ncbi:DUF5634 family protein [Sediminibacillus massiliensis]|uniref:DUF5634 family protein n=1 Tax=Sediminibacillus massiliensis TaxID=1926277 RepID=UPI0009888F64|nr:DUF5634 family protein [Sediminibacillus massiliensis]
MEYIPREQLISDLQDSFKPIMEKYHVDDIGVFEEEGQDDYYYAGYTVRKNGKVYMVHLPFRKNEQGHLAPAKEKWTVETDDADDRDMSGHDNLDDVFQELFH